MRTAAAVCKAILWIVLVFVFAVQALTIGSLLFNNMKLIEAEQLDKVFSLVPIGIAAVLLLGGTILFLAYRKRRYLGLILCAVAGVMFFIIAFQIRDAFPVWMGSDGRDMGVNTARMIWRHMTPVLVPLLMLAYWLIERSAVRNEPPALGKSSFDLSGAPLFRDENSRTAHEEPAKGATAAQLAGASVKRKKIRY